MNDPTELSDTRRILLERYRRGRLFPTATTPVSIPKRNESGPAPLSYSQQQIWLHSQLAGQALIYNEPVTILYHGLLNAAALERSFSAIVRRHEAWRTTFEWKSDQGVQTVQLAPDHIDIPFVDLRPLAPAERDREAIRLATEDIKLPFDLARGPMYRLRLVQVDDFEHRLYLTLHHLIFDGVSLYRVLLPELQTFYQAFVNTQAPALPRLPIQYSDYAAWQRSSMTEIAPEHYSYWKTVCTDLPVLNLPIDRPYPPVQTYHGATELFHLPIATASALKTLSVDQGVTPFMTMVAAFMALLHSYSGQEEIVVGGVSNGRHHSETMGLLGCFLNTIPIRCGFASDLPFTDFLSRVRKAVLGALSHDEVPFEMLVQEFAERRDTSRTPLVQALIVVEPPLDSLEKEWGFSYMDVDPGTAKFDLELGLDDRPDGPVGRFIYNTDLFEKETIVGLKSRWLQLLDRIATDPTSRLSNLTAFNSIGSVPELQQPLQAWNATDRKYPRDATIHELFQQQVQNKVSTTALICGETKVRYGQLNQRANQLAHRLRKMGVIRRQPIGLFLDRSPETFVAMLAILKAGGAYLPLDPAYPDERLSFMIRDSETSLILTNHRILGRDFLAALAKANERHVLWLDRENIDDESDRDPGNEVGADDPAYIIYTSGSTGQPKGVAIPHRGVVRLVQGVDYITFTPDETFLQLAPLSFDASTFEIWGALLNGAKLVVMPPGLPSLEQIGDAIREHGVTTLWLTAGLFNAIVDERVQDLRPLHQLLVGGEALSVPHVAKALAQLPETRLVNGYGPTESTTFACCHTITPHDSLGLAIPIGRPIANTTAYILDAQLRQVPVGTTGELCIGGDGLALGYWRNETLTLEKFVADPFSKKPGARLYRTGDCARWRNDGVIEFLGRADRQIKLHGYRIELAEVEAALNQQPGVVDSVVIIREDQPAKRKLVGYFIRQTGAQVNETALITGLKKLIPNYMVPSAIISLPVWPRTLNGKLDWNAFPSPESFIRSDSKLVSPGTPLEERVAAIWKAVLGIETLNVTDNFFDLGGHSLSALRLVNRLGQMLGAPVPLAMVFEAPTVSTMASLLEASYDLESRSASGTSPVPPIVSINRESRRASRL